MNYVIAILGLAVLMIVHEAGHYFAARAYGMRVLKFSIGFGPTFFRIEPDAGRWTFVAFGDRVKVPIFPHDPERHGPTVFQVAAIPFLAYVQVAGMNPLEELEPDDKGSYANASIGGRIVTIFAGPLANYLVASVFFFVPLYFDGKMALGEPTQVQVEPGKPAEAAGLQSGDRVVAVDGADVDTWDAMSARIVSSEGKEIPIVVLREGARVELRATPIWDPKTKRARIGIGPFMYKAKVGAGEAAKLAVEMPYTFVKANLAAIADLIRRKIDAPLHGPVEMVKQMKNAAQDGWADFMFFLASLSAYLAAFNLLPVPALDGGRLLFLGYEAATRKRPNPTVEAHIHAIGLVMMLGLMLYVTIANDLGLGGGGSK